MPTEIDRREGESSISRRSSALCVPIVIVWLLSFVPECDAVMGPSATIDSIRINAVMRSKRRSGTSSSVEGRSSSRYAFTRSNPTFSDVGASRRRDVNGSIITSFSTSDLLKLRGGGSSSSDYDFEDMDTDEQTDDEEEEGEDDDEEEEELDSSDSNEDESDQEETNQTKTPVQLILQTTLLQTQSSSSDPDSSPSTPLLLDQRIEINASRTRTVASLKQSVSRQFKSRPPIPTISLRYDGELLDDDSLTLQQILDEHYDEEDDDDDDEGDENGPTITITVDMVPPVDPKFGTEMRERLDRMTNEQVLDAYVGIWRRRTIIRWSW